MQEQSTEARTMLGNSIENKGFFHSAQIETGEYNLIWSRKCGQ